jgi:histidinol phosphatase-like PHP family hydrolase
VTPDFDYHVHTIYSGHSGPEMFVPAVMARCAELGLKRVLVLEHAPVMAAGSYASVDEWFAGRDDRTAAEAILAEVAPRRGAHPGTEFLVGAEVDADPERLDGSLMLRDLSGLDAVLASTHVLPGAAGFWFDPPEIPADERPALLERWLAWLERVAANPDVDVLAHPGAELYSCGLAGDFGAEFRTAFRPVLAAMARAGTAFELNETAVRRFPPAALEGYVELLRLAREEGVRFSAGSDAHFGSQLGDWKLVPAAASRAGLTPGDFWHPGGPASSPQSPQSR